ITLTTDTNSYVKGLKVKGSKENEAFFSYVKYNENIFRESKKLSEQLKNLELPKSEKDKILRKLDSLNKKSIEYKLNLIDSKPDLFVSKLLASMQDVLIPDSINKSQDSARIYRYYKNHYWDNLDLSDSRFIRTQMLDKKLTEYFERLVLFQPDTIINNIDLLIKKAIGSEENYSYLLWYFIREYQNPKYMGFDKVFVHLVENYFDNPDYKITNNTESVKETLVERSDKIKPLLLGKNAPNLILIDTSGNYTSFETIENKYLLIMFYDYECGICKSEIKYIIDNQQTWKYDIGIYAVNVNGDLDKWKEFITEHKIESWNNVNGTRSVTADFHDIYDIYGTPVLYLLNSERKIIAKRMGAEQIISIIERFEKSESNNQ
ncbi:MAG: hypothetical protein C0598_13280, partial [Marinilabiliales bacterium]